MEYVRDEIYDINDQIASLTLGNLGGGMLSIGRDIGRIVASCNKLKRGVSKRAWGDLFLVESSVVANYGVIMAVCQSLVGMFGSGVTPKIYRLCKLAVDSGRDIEDVISELEKYIAVDGGQYKLIWGCYAFVLLCVLSNICDHMAELDSVVVRGRNDCNRQKFDLSMLKRTGYLFGMTVGDNSQFLDKVNKVCTFNNCSIYSAIVKVNNSVNKYAIEVFGILQKLCTCCQKLGLVAQHAQMLAFIDTQMSKKPLVDASSYCLYPQLNILSNGRYTSVFDECGHGFVKFCDTKVIDGKRFLGGFGLKVCIGGDIYSVYDSARHYANYSSFDCCQKGVRIKTLATVMPDRDCEVRYLRICNQNNHTTNFDLIVDCNFCDDLVAVFDTQQNALLVYKSGFLYATLKTSLDSKACKSNLVCNINMQPQEHCELVICLHMYDSSVATKDIWRQLQRHIACPNPIDTFADNIKSLLSLLLYKKRPESNANLVVLKVLGGNIDNLYMGLFELKKLLRCATVAIVVLYSHPDIENDIQSRAMQMLRLLEIKGAKVVNRVYTDEEFLTVLDTCAIVLEELDDYNRRVVVGVETKNTELPFFAVCSMRDYYRVSNASSFRSIRPDHTIQLSPSYTEVDDKWCNLLQAKGAYCTVDQFGRYYCFDNAYSQNWQDGIVVGEKDKLWSPMLSVLDKRDNGAEYLARHKLGVTQFECDYNNIVSSDSVCIDSGARHHSVHLHNKSSRKRALSVMFFVDLSFVQGTVFEIQREGNKVVIKDTIANKAYTIASSCNIDSFCCSAESFANKYGAIVRCQNLVEFGGVVPCVAISCNVNLLACDNGKVEFWVRESACGVDKNCIPKQTVSISVETPDKIFDTVLAWLPYSFNKFDCDNLLCVFGLIYTDFEVALGRLGQAINDNTRDLVFVLAVTRLVEFDGNKGLLKRVANKNGRMTTLIEHCFATLKAHCIFDSNGLVIRADSVVCLQDTLMLVYAIRSLLTVLDDMYQIKYWLKLADNLADIVNSKFWLGRYYGASGDSIDVATQSLAILSNTADKERTSLVVDSVVTVLQTTVPSVDCQQLVWFAKALLHAQRAKQAYSILQNIAIIGNTDCGVFCDTKPNWHGFLYDCLVGDIVGLRIKGNAVKFEPNIPSHWDNCLVSMSINNTSVNIKIKNQKLTGDWIMSIDNIKYNINGIVISDSLDDKTIELRR